MFFKCKMCGGTLDFEIGATIAVCEYCGIKQTLPRLDDDRRANLYDRANHFRRNNEFDKAAGLYEQILNEDPRDPEAYWSLVLCRYGIEYIEDPVTHKRVPTVNRTQFTSIYDDEDYKSALQYAGGYQRALYEEEASTINEIQKSILAISQKEEPFDVFICYKETDASGRRTQDSVLANDIYHQLTNEGFKVFFSRITLEDKLGTAYEPYIFAALNSAKVMVVLGTKPEYFNAVWVKNEWSRYLALVNQSSGKKVLIPAYRDMDPYDLPEEFSHLQAQDMSKLGFMQDLIRGINKIAKADEPKQITKETVVIGGNVNVAPLLKRAFMFLEDGNWSEADSYCEKVLDQDPENAQAYLGKLMAELRVRQQEDLPNCEQPFNNSNNFQKVLRFGDEKLAGVLSGYIDHINERNENDRLTSIYNKAVTAMNGAKKESEYQSAAKAFKTIPGFQDADALAEQCLERSEVCRKEAIYASAISLMNRNTVNGYKAAAETFKTISEFKDSDELAEQCFERAEVCRKDSIYASAMSQKAENTVSGYDAAIKTFQKISGWKDADEQIYACQRMSEELKVKEEAERLERERQAEQSRIAAEKASKKFNRIIAITVSMIVACIVFVIVLINVIIPKQKYNEAMSLLDSGDYDAAYALLQELGHNDEITSSKYDRAKKLLDSGDYDAAYVLLYESGHSDEITSSKYDRAKKLLDSGDYDAAYVLLYQSGHSDEITSSKYDRAKKLLDSGDYDAAYVLLLQSGHSDEIASSKYDRAVALIDSGDFDAALLLLDGLNYKDSADKVVECKYGSAMELYNSQQYEAAFIAFNSINYKDSEDKARECVFQMQKAGLTNVTVGDTIKFGIYEQDNDTSNGQEEIAWVVLAVDGDKALIISKYALDCQPFDFQEYSAKTDTSWEECSLRTWLNGTFYNDAFSADHQEMIISSTDNVFLLSASEAEEYFTSDSARKCYGTNYSIAQGALKHDNGCVWWWLRPPLDDATRVASVNFKGAVSQIGNWAGTTDVGVRPALWINLES